MKDIKTLLSRNIKFLENVFFGGVVRGSVEKYNHLNDINHIISKNTISHLIVKYDLY